MAANLHGFTTCIGPGKHFEATRIVNQFGQGLSDHLMHPGDEYSGGRKLWRHRAAGIRSVICD
jgi:hypothetical protein